MSGGEWPTMPNEPISIVQVSDTHVSGKRAYFLDNWDVFVDLMRADAPDLIVHPGDLSFDGAGDSDDLAFAAREQERLSAPWLALPGNHDIGESLAAIRLDQPTNVARRAAWASHFGPTQWMRDIGEWRLVGLDTSLMGCDTPEEAAQRRFLEETLASRAGCPVLLFQHMPPYLTEADDPALTTLAVPHAARHWLFDTCLSGGVKAIACGHVHVYRHLSYRGIDIVWAPATSFFNIIERQKFGCVPRAGYVEWTLNGDKISHRLVEPPLMLTHDVGAWNKAQGSTTKMPPRPAPTGR
jgi:3',5'-cyclic AMP phosphodiesterase CpdA